MSYIRASYIKTGLSNSAFSRGIELLEQGRPEASAQQFLAAMNSVSSKDRCFNRYRSYYGLSSLLSGRVSAIDDCRRAVIELPDDGDVCLNLARAELLLSNRLQAIESIEIGLSYSSSHAGLRQLQEKIGVRLRKPLPLLPRDCFLSRLVGRHLLRNK